MNKKVFNIIFIMFVAIFAMCISSGKVMADNTYSTGNYNYTVNGDGTVTITKYNGSETDCTIPSTLDGKNVTSIGDGAFSNCIQLTTITIPAGVTSIGVYAFGDCSQLTTITIPDSVTSIGDGAFSNCGKLTTIEVDQKNNSYKSKDGVLFSKNGKNLIKYPEGKLGTSYTIPAGVTSIGYSAFVGCSQLATITIPDSVTSIGYNAFCCCSQLTTIEVDPKNNSYKSADGVLFSKNGENLIKYPEGKSGTDYTIPAGVRSIGAYAFGYCQLTTIIIPANVTSIGDNAFYSCRQLTTITIPANVTSIGDAAFWYCTKLSSITISNSSTIIGNYVFGYTPSGFNIITYGDPNDPNNKVKKYADDNGKTCKVLSPLLEEAVEAAASNINPAVGVDNTITLKLKDSQGKVDSNFNGLRLVTISGVKKASDGTYGNITYNDGTTDHKDEKLNSNSETTGQLIYLNFVKGQATIDFKLNAAEEQNIQFSVGQKTNPITASLTITPKAAITWTTNYPKSDKITTSSVEVLTKTNEDGKVFWVCLPSGAQNPTSEQVKEGQDSSGASLVNGMSGNIITNANSEGNFTVNGLKASTKYDIYAAAEDKLGNLEASAKKVTVTTSDLEKVAVPTASPISGAVYSGTIITLSSSTAGATIHYTTNGDNPTALSAVYSVGIPVNSAMTIKAIAVKSGMPDSDVMSASYSINNPPPSGISFSVQFKGSAERQVNNLVVTPNGANEYHFNLFNALKTELENDENAVTSTATYVDIKAGSKNIRAEFNKINITDEALKVGIKIPVTIKNSVTVFGNNISDGKYNATLKMTPGSTNSDFELTLTKLAAPAAFTVNTPASEDNKVNDDGKSKVTVTWTDSVTPTVDHYEIVAKVGAVPDVNDTVLGETSIAKETQAASFDWDAGDNLYVGVVAVDTNGLKTLCSGTTANVTVAADGHAPTITVPGAPTNVTASAGDGYAVVYFTSPVNDGGSSITSYAVTSSQGGITKVGTSSPITVAGLTDGTAYTFTVKAVNTVGEGTASAVSNSVTPYYVPPYTPPTPVQENVSVPVEIGTGEKKSTVNINAVRALDTDGLEKGTLKLDEDTSKKIAESAIDAKSREADVVLPTNTQYSKDKVDIQLPKESITELSNSNISLNIGKGKAALKLPSQTLAALKDKDAEIKIKQLTDSSKIEETKSLILQMTSGGKSVSTPVSIETNFSGRAKITLPIDVSKFTNKDDLNKYLSSLAVAVQHSDGENAVDKGTIEYDTKGNAIGISIWVNKFSNFTLIQLPEDYFKGKTTVMKNKAEADKEWHLKFTKAADPSTVTPENIYVTDLKGNKVDVKVSCESDDVIKVSPVNPYKSGETYYIYISKKVTSKYKKPLTEDLRYEFTVK